MKRYHKHENNDKAPRDYLTHTDIAFVVLYYSWNEDPAEAFAARKRI